MIKSLFVFQLLCVFSFGFLNPVKDNTKKGNDFYKKGDFNNALVYYNKALMENPGEYLLHYNVANIFYKMKKYDEAMSNYEHSLFGAEKKDTAAIHYNLGNAAFKKKDYEKAVQSYVNSLKIESENKQTKYNLELAIKKLREQSKEQKNHQKQES